MSTPSLLFLEIAIISSLLSLLATSALAATDQLKIVINEIAWMGTQNSPHDEWIELYNNSSSPIDINNWELRTEDGTPKIILKGKISPKGFFLLERTDDTTLANLKADLIYKGGLNNKGEHLKLIDVKGEIIDEIDCSEGWFGGNNETKQTMERKNSSIVGSNPKNWQTSQNSGGTPKAKNSQEEKNKELNPRLPEKESQTEKIEDKEELAMIDKQVSGSSKPFFTFLIALFIATSSGIFVLFLKRKVEKD